MCVCQAPRDHMREGVCHPCMVFRVQGLKQNVWYSEPWCSGFSGFLVWGSGFRVWGGVFGDYGLEFRVEG